MEATTCLQSRKAEEGFTLIELSIVLVIIGLIVGGILVGQDMIRGAEIRATVAQLEKLNSAVNTFRNKYNGAPGDLLNPTNFGFTARTSNGDGLLQSCTGEGGAAEAKMLIGCADKFFWNDLSAASLISESFTDVSGAAALATLPAPFSTYFPQAKTGPGTYIMVWASGGLNYFFLHGITSITLGVPVLNNALTPITAFQIDTKMDDGVAGTGSVQGNDATDGTPNSLGSGAALCATGGAYNTTGVTATTPLCGLQIRTSF